MITSTLDADGVPCAPVAGETYCTLAAAYDEAGRVVLERYFDRSGNPVRCLAGYPQVRRAYDADGRFVRESYDDEQGQPLTIPAGYAAFSRTYDEQGRLISECYQGEDGQPCLNSLGYAEVRSTWDGKRLTEEAFFDTLGEAAARTDGVARIYYTYNSKGKRTGTICYDLAGEVINP